MQARSHILLGLILAIVFSGAFNTVPGQANGQSEADTVAAQDSFTPMELIKFPSPIYPDECHKRGIEAIVHVGLIVNEAGNVAQVFQAHTDFDSKLARHMDKNRLRRFAKLFEDSAIAAVKQFEFKPATRGGKPVAQRVCDMKIRFQLHD
ncbi:MAG: hypothetical protein NTW97_05895 [Candidatus Krumholzibacteria bacterium]|nr:hypothetical protein [Candidatus Krumholzibacteria bacterium]